MLMKGFLNFSVVFWTRFSRSGVRTSERDPAGVAHEQVVL